VAEQPTGSLERSLQWALGLLVVAVILSLTGAGLWVGREGAQRFIASRLAHDAEALIAGLDPQRAELTRPLPPIYSQPFSGHYFGIRLDEGSVLRSRSLWDHPFEVDALAPGQTALGLDDGPRAQPLLVWRAGYEKQGVTFTVAVAEDLTPLLRVLRRLLWVLIGLSLLGVLTLLSVQRWLLRRDFQRVGAVREDVRRLAAGEIDRLRVDVPAEILPLVQELNGFIDAWGRHLQRSRQSLGNLAHALKTPLNLILLKHPPGAGDTVSEQAQRMRELIDRELRRARAAGEGGPGRRFDVRTEIADLVHGIRSLYKEKGLEVTSRLDVPDRLPFDQEDMLELIGNLLDNAAKWASHRVRLSLAWKLGLSIQVEDDGPGVEPAVIDELSVRGSRFDELTQGHGLGLAITREIVELYGGRLQFRRSADLGGFSALVELPGSRGSPGREMP
jgi:signal transduction histidine kinase